MVNPKGTRTQSSRRRPQVEEFRHQDRVRELDEEGEPVSLAEEIADEGVAAVKTRRTATNGSSRARSTSPSCRR